MEYSQARSACSKVNYYQSFADLKNKASRYFMIKRFNLNMRLSIKGGSITSANWYTQILIKNDLPFRLQHIQFLLRYFL